MIDSVPTKSRTKATSSLREAWEPCEFGIVRKGERVKVVTRSQRRMWSSRKIGRPRLNSHARRDERLILVKRSTASGVNDRLTTSRLSVKAQFMLLNSSLEHSGWDWNLSLFYLSSPRDGHYVWIDWYLLTSKRFQSQVLKRKKERQIRKGYNC